MLKEHRVFKMNENLNFKPGYYKITKLVEPNVIEVEGTWFIKLKWVGDHTPKEEILLEKKKQQTERFKLSQNTHLTASIVCQ